jgi:hypothetical protein
MWKDPIVQELHDLRAQISRDLDGDMHRYAQLMRESQIQRLQLRPVVQQAPYITSAQVSHYELNPRGM